MTFITGILSALLLLDCLVLVLLVLIQLPKKEAGAGVAFGAGTADALFGAGTGNALTNITKYAATLFLGLALLLTMAQGSRNRQAKTGVGEALKKVSVTAPTALPPAVSNKSMEAAPLETASKPMAITSSNVLVTKATNASAKTAPASASKP